MENTNTPNISFSSCSGWSTIGSWSESEPGDGTDGTEIATVLELAHLLLVETLENVQQSFDVSV